MPDYLIVMENEISPGDWIVFPITHYSVPKQALGGPWGCARVNGENRSTWSVQGLYLKTGLAFRWVFKSSVRASFLSRGEAEMCVAALTRLEQNYLEERKSLKPRFKRFIDIALGAPTTEGE